jgi:hypothetical protein
MEGIVSRQDVRGAIPRSLLQSSPPRPLRLPPGIVIARVGREDLLLPDEVGVLVEQFRSRRQGGEGASPRSSSVSRMCVWKGNVDSLSPLPSWQ